MQAFCLPLLCFSDRHVVLHAVMQSASDCKPFIGGRAGLASEHSGHLVCVCLDDQMSPLEQPFKVTNIFIMKNDLQMTLVRLGSEHFGYFSVSVWTTKFCHQSTFSKAPIYLSWEIISKWHLLARQGSERFGRLFCVWTTKFCQCMISLVQLLVRAACRTSCSVRTIQWWTIF